MKSKQLLKYRSVQDFSSYAAMPLYNSHKRMSASATIGLYRFPAEGSFVDLPLKCS